MAKTATIDFGTKDTKDGSTTAQTIHSSIFPRTPLTMQITVAYGFLTPMITIMTMAKEILMA